ncbi:MAG TPA: Dabb family protein [Balneolales bacterium]|nr:Dabb family protein [Balneolales bacterium]
MAILHSVYIYLKDDVSSEILENMKTDILNDLSKIETVQKVYAGGPLGVDRDVVDNDYSMSLQAFFEDRDSMMAYQKDPVHLNFVAKYKEHWDHIRVFDSQVDA